MTFFPACRHCGRTIIPVNDSDRWTHERPRLIRCRQPEDVTVYGYEALPDNGEACECWACQRYGSAVRTPDEVDEEQT